MEEMYFKVNTSEPYWAQIWTSQTDRHPLKTASLMIFLNSPLASLAGRQISFKIVLCVSLEFHFFYFFQSDAKGDSFFFMKQFILEAIKLGQPSNHCELILEISNSSPPLLQLQKGRRQRAKSIGKREVEFISFCDYKYNKSVSPWTSDFKASWIGDVLKLSISSSVVVIASSDATFGKSKKKGKKDLLKYTEQKKAY